MVDLKSQSTDQALNHDQILPIISEMFEEDPKSLEVILRFVNGLEGRIRNLNQNLVDNNFTELKSNTHTLCGSAALFGYPRLHEILALLEIAASLNQITESENLLKQTYVLQAKILKGIEIMTKLQDVDFANNCQNLFSINNS